MVHRDFFKIFLPVLLIFVVSTGFFITSGTLFSRWHIDTSLVIVGNLVLFLATMLSFFLYYRALQNNNVQAFLRMIYGGMFLKMMICLFTAFIYIMVAGKAVNKGGVIVCLFLYLIYSFVEVALLLKQSKQKKNV